MKATGGCHCGAVRFSVEVPREVDLLECNCSICRKSGFLHLIVAGPDFTIERGEGELLSYRFGTGMAEHLFCRVCGIKSFYRPRSHPGAWSVNFRCLDSPDEIEVSVRAFDGVHWEAARQALDRGSD